MDYQVYTLPNGIRLLHKHAVSTIAHCCFLVNAGARDEEAGKDGLAHFIEHLLFKATERRNTNQILNHLELVGADLNAYTTKEYTCIHASFLKEHLERAIDLTEDLVFHSTFPEEELVKEKSVILDEIASYLDQPDEAIQDDFEDVLFKGHPLGRNILGTVESVNQLNKKDISHFIAQNYNTHQMVFAVLGEYDFKKLVKLAERYFGDIKANTAVKNRIKPIVKPGELVKLSRPISQTHGVIGSQAYASSNPQKNGLLLLNNILGGIGMSSRLNLQIREKYGIAYSIESNYMAFSDTGLFTIYFGTDSEKAERAIRLIHKELKKLREEKLGVLQLQQAKRKFIGQIALGEENKIGLIIAMAKSLLDFDRIDTLEEIFAKINAATAEEMLAISNEIFDPAVLTTLLFEPND
ncbi:M16 family metallopeptidase [Mucilaginibacter paludis]|uniref:Peptidase M16 domain protein n=1 Tax=Mucilaginibacter paludis DSM 18603 TaxID=714943 RepID=H1YGY7_9SPHI|nr:pitrilysin family protein [Mucilaginibacter paludis]EHQ27396.1 peptidase M16 domain protein [Mucilaginibacter paludis DSM 18603]